MTSILNNIAALGAANQLGATSKGLQATIERLTTGKRINKASDDAAGLAISNRLNADIKISNQAQRNANDGVSFLTVADGTLDEVTSLLTRASELAQQAKTGTITDSNRASLDSEFQNIVKTLTDIGTNTTFNGTAIFTSTAVNVSLGSFSAVNVSAGAMAASLSGDLTSSTNATTATGAIQTALDAVSSQRASIGSNMQRLTSMSNILGTQVQNYTAAASQITDANVAQDVVALSKYQILNQSGVSALAQANTSAQTILALLR